MTTPEKQHGGFYFIQRLFVYSVHVFLQGAKGERGPNGEQGEKGDKVQAVISIDDGQGSSHLSFFNGCVLWIEILVSLSKHIGNSNISFVLWITG